MESEKAANRPSYIARNYPETKLDLLQYLAGFLDQLPKPIDYKEMAFIKSALDAFNDTSDKNGQSRALIYLLCTVPRWFKKVDRWWAKVGHYQSLEVYADSKKIPREFVGLEELCQIWWLTEVHLELARVAQLEKYCILRDQDLDSQDKEELLELETVEDIHAFMANKLIKY